jgi:hypothetical protein
MTNGIFFLIHYARYCPPFSNGPSGSASLIRSHAIGVSARHHAAMRAFRRVCFAPAFHFLWCKSNHSPRLHAIVLRWQQQHEKSAQLMPKHTVIQLRPPSRFSCILVFLNSTVLLFLKRLPYDYRLSRTNLPRGSVSRPCPQTLYCR